MNPVRIRRLNEPGLARMAEFLDSFISAPDRPVDFQEDLWPILTGLDTTTHVPNVVQADADRRFPRRYDLAEYLHGLIPRLGLADPTRDQGLWAWLALLWFEQLAPVEKGRRKVGERAKWIPLIGVSRRYYRHLILGPYEIYLTNQDRPERAAVLLHNPPYKPGELVGQLAATQHIAQSKAAVGAATMLYYDRDRKVLKAGAAGKGPGSPRRYRTVLDHFDRTFDLHSITEEQLLNLLPREFERFKPRRA
jgi:hypothetical protein